MTDDRKERLLKNLPFWPDLTEAQRDLVRLNSRFALYEKDAFIHGGAGHCLGMIMVVSGLVRAYLLSEEGREVTLFRLDEGKTCIFAASCVIDQLTFEAHVSAETDTELLVLSAPAFLVLKEENIHVECCLYKLATERFSEVMWAMQQLLFMGFDRRLSLFLCQEAERSGSMELTMTHEQIARLIGSAREVVTRMLRRFAEDGLIEIHRGTVIIAKPKELKKIAGENRPAV